MPGLWLTSIKSFFAWPLQTSTMKYSNTVPYNYFRPNLVILLNGQRQNRSRLTFSKLEQNFQLHSNSTKLKICMSNSNPNLSPTRLKFSSNALFRRNCRSIVSIVQDQINEQEVLLGATGLTKNPYILHWGIVLEVLPFFSWFDIVSVPRGGTSASGPSPAIPSKRRWSPFPCQARPTGEVRSRLNSMPNRNPPNTSTILYLF